ncbi:hypothetical protein [Streptomyces camelliae]|uniref:Uncharacterized protein n=1 Tax=Streptomyces camelliae TaxID=3004093 RepID=A0ABY7NV42_9ACTN|nr:hypothetical protein [Streptomyces sp. HUAS 2-6]WBO62047.1 hypothetical protein O1G22_03955 [Streptomyces sp. HUAS 2-6]
MAADRTVATALRAVLCIAPRRFGLPGIAAGDAALARPDALGEPPRAVLGQAGARTLVALPVDQFGTPGVHIVRHRRGTPVRRPLR